MEVQVFSRHDTVRLHLNGGLIGEKPTRRNQEFNASFNVPYSPGELKITGLTAEKEIESVKIRTVGQPRKLLLTPDRTRIKADGQDLSFVIVEIVDRQKNRRWDADDPVEYRITGPGLIAGIGNADLTTTQSYRANPRRVYQGRAIVVIRSTGEPGRIKLKAEAAGLRPASVVIHSARSGGTARE